MYRKLPTWILLWTLTTFCTPASAQIINSGFETGDLSGWTSSGNGVIEILSGGELDTIGPTEGSFFALVSNGPGDRDDDGLPDSTTLTTTQFSVSPEGATLLVTWNFLTAEFTGLDADPLRLDSYEFQLTASNGPVVTFLYGDVGATDFFQLVDNGNPIITPGGSAFFEAGSLRTLSFGIAPGLYTLSFVVTDSGDGAFDSALVLDDLRLLSGAITAPEPKSLTFLLMAACSLFAVNRQRLSCDRRKKSRPYSD